MLDIDMQEIKDKLEDKEPETKNKFIPAPDVEEVAKELIRQYHPHLLNATISYVFRDGSWNKNERPVMGDVKLMSPYLNMLTGFDFGVIVNYRLWLSLSVKERKQAIVDHLLSFCYFTEDKNGDLKWKKISPSIHEFPEIVARHGAYNADLEDLTVSMNEFQKG